jgi:hypothetical protein
VVLVVLVDVLVDVDVEEEVEVLEEEELDELDDELGGGVVPPSAVAVKLRYPNVWRPPQSSFRARTPTAPAPCSAPVLSEVVSCQVEGSDVPSAHTRARMVVGPAPVNSARIHSTTPSLAVIPVFVSFAMLLPSLRWARRNTVGRPAPSTAPIR